MDIEEDEGHNAETLNKYQNMAYIPNKNYAHIRGNIGREPKTSRFQGDAFVVNLTIATSESYKPKGSDEWKQTTEWHNVTIWNDKNALGLKKGDTVDVEGKIRTKKDTDANGNERWTTYIQAERIFLIPKSYGPSSVGDMPEDDQF